VADPGEPGGHPGPEEIRVRGCPATVTADETRLRAEAVAPPQFAALAAEVVFAQRASSFGDLRQAKARKKPLSRTHQGMGRRGR
jgi:hypothetical protein